MWLAVLFAPIMGSVVLRIIFEIKYPVQTGIVVISGASTGIGRHAAVHLAGNGYTVFAGVRKEIDADSIRNLQIKGLYPVILDVTKHESCVSALETVSQFSRENGLPIVALVNNAGVSRKFPAELHDLSDIRRVFDTNFFGMVDLTQTFIPVLRESKGRIVMISSLSGLVSKSAPLSESYLASNLSLSYSHEQRLLRLQVRHGRLLRWSSTRTERIWHLRLYHRAGLCQELHLCHKRGRVDRHWREERARGALLQQTL
jgi:NADP-dependent 3-hydroxy acid dehydrogenase YdfG